jgi:bla regulator protein blaR1
LRQLIQAAYRRGGFEIRQVSGGPKWMDSDRFDIDATVDGSLSVGALYLPDGKGSAGLGYLMLRTLLADRFKLVLHSETRQLPIYALRVAGRDNTLGPQLHKSDVDCDAVLAETARTGQPVPPRVQGQMPPCSTQTGPGHMAANAISMSQLADMLTQFAERETHDETGLRGNFDLTLDWNDDVSIFTAIQEQLRLKLEPSRGPVDVLVIDHVERPTPD